MYTRMFQSEIKVLLGCMDGVEQSYEVWGVDLKNETAVSHGDTGLHINRAAAREGLSLDM